MLFLVYQCAVVHVLTPLRLSQTSLYNPLSIKTSINMHSHKPRKSLIKMKRVKTAAMTILVTQWLDDQRERTKTMLGLRFYFN